MKSSRAEYLKYKESARALIFARIEHFSKIYPYKFNRIAIRNLRSRWGSCSSKGNLNFNYKLIHLKPEHQDYIIVHELCHLKELNHSKNFWDLVKKTFPNYKEIHKQIHAESRNL